MEYNFRELEQKWQKYWNDTDVYKVSNESNKPKFYVLDMFPYPSGAGLHVGHPLGYIASDIFSRYKRLNGFNVLHPMGYDAFGLPAEQYAIDHGVHPATSTSANINNFRKQLDKIGFSYDWSRQVNTSEPEYYKWTQWIFLQLFNSFYNRATKKATPISELIASFEKSGSAVHPVPNASFANETLGVSASFTADEWNGYSYKQKQTILMEYRLAFCGHGEVNWCEALGTVLANDEVINGLSERGGHPVVKKKLRQWYLRITEYADRLIEGLNTVDFSESMKEMQTNWIGKSYGANIRFAIKDQNQELEVYTTRPDTIFGVDFMVVAPEHDLVSAITTAEQKAEVEAYVAYVNSRSERERQAEKKISGAFTGAYAINPFSGKLIPIWLSEYVLAGYGTGAIMAVPCGDERDFKFAQHFNIPVTNILGSEFNGEEANSTKDAKLENSDFLNGIVMRDAMAVVNQKIEELGIGKPKTNFRIRDAAFSRQRYWGEPFPIKWTDGIAEPIDLESLPLSLPFIDKYGPGPEGEGPLANLPEWVAQDFETNTMPGYAGSSWYFLRYMDPHNNQAFASRQATDYWNQVDIYIGGTEHAVGHLLYSRLWTKVLFDLGHIGFDEPFKKLVNQGMIQGSSRFVYRVRGTNKYVSSGLKGDYETDELHVDVNFVDGYELDIEKFSRWREEYINAEFILEDGKYICGSLTEKMSKRLYNTVNPDDLVDKYGADTFRMYEMFLGPVEQSKPWDTKGIEGVHRFLRKLWRLFYNETNGLIVNNDTPTAEELKVLHKTIKKISEDTERFSFNTAVSNFMIAVNELSDLKCHKKQILEQILILLAPYAPHIAEELYKEALGNNTSVLDAAYPAYDASLLVENSKEYPVSVNGKLRTTLVFPLDAAQADIETVVLENEVVKKWIEDKPVKKFIFVKGRMINVVI